MSAKADGLDKYLSTQVFFLEQRCKPAKSRDGMSSFQAKKIVQVKDRQKELPGARKVQKSTKKTKRNQKGPKSPKKEKQEEAIASFFLPKLMTEVLVSGRTGC